MKRDHRAQKGGGGINKEEQIAIWIETYQNLIFSLCYKMVGNYFTAEDLAQDTFVAAYTHLERFDGQYEKAWLCRIAVHKCLDFLKKENHYTAADSAELLQSLADTENVETQVLAQEVAQELKNACIGLKEPYRSVAIAHFCEEKSVSEIAQEQDKNSKTVQTQICRARAKLQKLYQRRRNV